MSTTLDQILAAAEQDLVPLTAESAGYIVLALVDRLAAAPQLVSAEQVTLGESGEIVASPGKPTEDLQCERALRTLLGRLLGVSRVTSPPLNLAAARPAKLGVEAFGRELEVALIPANRSAARRSLARLCRETVRARLDPSFVEPTEGSQCAPEVAPAACDLENHVPDLVAPEELSIDVDLLIDLEVHAHGELPSRPALSSVPATDLPSAVALPPPLLPLQSQPNELPPLAPAMVVPSAALVAPSRDDLTPAEPFVLRARAAAARASSPPPSDELTEAADSLLVEEEPQTEIVSDVELIEFDPSPVVGVPVVAISEPPPPKGPSRLRSPRRELTALLNDFAVSESGEPAQVARGLKQLAGLDLTPMPRALALDD